MDTSRGGQILICDFSTYSMFLPLQMCTKRIGIRAKRTVLWHKHT